MAFGARATAEIQHGLRLPQRKSLRQVRPTLLADPVQDRQDIGAKRRIRLKTCCVTGESPVLMASS